MTRQISFFDGKEDFKIRKPIRLIELFGGIGCQVKDPLNNNVILEKQVRVSVDLHKAITKQMEELGWL